MGDVCVAAVVDVVKHEAVQANAVLFEHDETEQGVINASQPSAGNKDDGISLLLNMING